MANLGKPKAKEGSVTDRLRSIFETASKPLRFKDIHAGVGISEDAGEVMSALVKLVDRGEVVSMPILCRTHYGRTEAFSRQGIESANLPQLCLPV